MTLHSVVQLPARVFVPCFLAVYLLLDWVTFIPSFSPLGITPWNPPAGLSFGILLLKGPVYLLLLPLCVLMSDLLVRGLPLPVGGLLAEVAVASVSYVPGLMYLWYSRSPKFDVRLGTIQDLLRLAMVATASAAVLSISYVGVLVLLNYLPAEQFGASSVRYWVGETIGIMVLTPFLLLLVNPAQRFRLTRQLLAQLAAVLLSVVFVFGVGPGQQEQLFYVLFLPIVWIAVRSGLESVVIALVVMQVAIMVALHLGQQDAVNVTQVQAVMLVLVCAGLAIGMLVRERGRAETHIRLQQDAIARAARLGSIDRLTTSIAHEINQPLTAMGNYCRAAIRALDAPDINHKLVRDASIKALQQVDRVSAVIQRLRNLIILGRAELQPVDVSELIAGSIELMRPDLSASSVQVTINQSKALPRVMADQLQIQQLLTNIIRNAIEAMKVVPVDQREIRVLAATHQSGKVEIVVSDRGPGFPEGFRLVPDAPNPTSKDNGLGIGLTLCHSIVEAHGGRLTISESGQPGTVRFTLVTAQGEGHAEPQ